MKQKSKPMRRMGVRGEGKGQGCRVSVLRRKQRGRRRLNRTTCICKGCVRTCLGRPVWEDVWWERCVYVFVCACVCAHACMRHTRTYMDRCTDRQRKGGRDQVEGVHCFAPSAQPRGFWQAWQSAVWSLQQGGRSYLSAFPLPLCEIFSCEKPSLEL